MTTRQQVADEARAWIGTPFRHQACLVRVGCDCIGLIAGVALKLNLPGAKEFRRDQEFTGYGRLPDPELLRRACRRYMDPVPIAEATLGDVLLMTFLLQPMHFGIVSNLEPRRMIHAYEPVGRVSEHGIDAKWQRRVVAAFHLRGVS